MSGAEDAEATPIDVIRDLHRWFAAVPFEAAREALVSTETWEEFRLASLERGFEYPDVIDPGVEIPAEGIGGLRDEVGFKGLDGWVRFWRAWFEPWADYEWTISNVEQVGDRVIIDGSNVAHGRGSGAPVRWDNTQVWTVRSGKVVHLVGYETRGEAMAALDSD